MAAVNISDPSADLVRPVCVHGHSFLRKYRLSTWTAFFDELNTDFGNSISMWITF